MSHHVHSSLKTTEKCIWAQLSAKSVGCWIFLLHYIVDGIKNAWCLDIDAQNVLGRRYFGFWATIKNWVQQKAFSQCTINFYGQSHDSVIDQDMLVSAVPENFKAQTNPFLLGPYPD